MAHPDSHTQVHKSARKATRTSAHTQPPLRPSRTQHLQPHHSSRAKQSSRATPARRAACTVLRHVRERNAFANELLERAFLEAHLSAEDKAFATRLVRGVVSAQGTLDELIDSVLSKPSDIEPCVRDALRLATYELIFMDKEAHAAVDQGVELVRSCAPRAGGVANFVLHRIVEAKPHFPFGDPRTSLAAFARLHAFPKWIAQRLVHELGVRDAHTFMRASNDAAPLFVFAGVAGGHETEIHELLCSVDARPKPEPKPVSMGSGVLPACYRLHNTRAVADGRIVHAFNTGQLLVSDASAQAIVQFSLPDAPPKRFLEIGAGRGTKTILFQSEAYRRYGAQIPEYVAVDNHEFKCSLLRKRAERFGIKVSQTLCADAQHLSGQLESKSFDAVFIDAPCSGLGTLRRHPEIRWRIRPETITEHARLGAAILSACAPLVRYGGQLSYSTCTVFAEENMDVIRSFLESKEGADFSLVKDGVFASRLTPGSADAHFCAKLIRDKKSRA